MTYKEQADKECAEFNLAHRAMQLKVMPPCDAETLPFQWALSGKKLDGMVGPAVVTVCQWDEDNWFWVHLENGDIYDMVSCSYGDASWIEVRKRDVKEI